MIHKILTFILCALSFEIAGGQTKGIVVADSVTHTPLPNASVFDRHGKLIGVSDAKGWTTFISPELYPITVRYIGFNEKTVTSAEADTVLLQETFNELPEVLVEERTNKVLHMLAYVREYSTLTTYTDTVFLFREKMVDYMLPTDKKVKFRGWHTPRVLTCRSYYKFTNSNGLDSVGNKSNHHFSWSDWIGTAPVMEIPMNLRAAETGVDTVKGRYSPTEIWTRDNDRISVSVDVLADTTSRKWVPDLSGFFISNLDFDQFKLSFDYRNVVEDSISPMDLSGYSFSIESRGRGHDMFRFNRNNEPYFVSTLAEVYFLDKEYITASEARKWEKRQFDTGEIGIYEPMDAPELSAQIMELVARVNNLDETEVRLSLNPDRNLVSNNVGRGNFKIGHRALSLLKQMTGITYYKAHRKFDKKWTEFKRTDKKKKD
ncbi:MAG: carboxypeptidase-like regulatory domain-containing protein [Muribaculaceae bacterium]|nr:carboxypeptidase-like regulatory domain-containing protein [Muribaculaceae bacterium]